MADEEDFQPVAPPAGRPRARLSDYPIRARPSAPARAAERLTNALTQAFGGQVGLNVAAGKGASGVIGGVSAGQAVGAGAGLALGGPVGLAAGSFAGSLIDPAEVQATPEDVVRRFGMRPTFINTMTAALLTDPFGTAGGFGVAKDFAISTKLGVRFLKAEAKPLFGKAVQTVVQQTGVHSEEARSIVAGLLGDVVTRETRDIVGDRQLMERLKMALGETDPARVIQAVEFTKRNLVSRPTIRLGGKEIPRVADFEARRQAFIDSLKTRVGKAIEPTAPIQVDKKFVTGRAIRFKQAIEAVSPKTSEGKLEARAIWERAVTSGTLNNEDAPVLIAAGEKMGIDVAGFLKEPTNLFLTSPAAKGVSKSARYFVDAIDSLGRKFGVRKYDPQLEGMWRDFIRRKTHGMSVVGEDLAGPYRNLTEAERRSASSLPDVAGGTIAGIRREVARQVETLKARPGFGEAEMAAARALQKAADARVQEVVDAAIRSLPGSLPDLVLETDRKLKNLFNVMAEDGTIVDFVTLHMPHLFQNPQAIQKTGIGAKFGVRTSLDGRDIERIINDLTGNPLFATLGVAKQVGLDPETDIYNILTAVATDYVAAHEGRRFLREVGQVFGKPEKDFLRTVSIQPDDLRSVVEEARAAHSARTVGQATETSLQVKAKGIEQESITELERYAKLARLYEIPEGRGYAPQVSTYRKVEGFPEIPIQPRPGGPARAAETLSQTGAPQVATRESTDLASAFGSPSGVPDIPRESIEVRIPSAVPTEPVRLRSDIAQALEDLAPEFLSAPATNAIARFSNLLTDMFKASVTIFPLPFAFASKQFLGNTYNAMIGMGVSALNPFRTIAAYRVGFTEANDVWKTVAGPYTFAELRKMVDEQVLLKGLGARQSMSAASLLQEGATRRIREVGLRRTVRERGALGTARGVAQDVGSFPDKLARIQLFMHYLADGLDATTAAAQSRRLVHDISQFTPFEQTWARVAIPFYAWPRHNIPLQLRSMMERPALASVTLKSFDAAGPSDKDKRRAPDYLLDQLMVAMGMTRNGNLLILGNLNLPVEDVLRLMPSDGWRRVVEREVLGRVNPILSIPLQQATGRVFFTGRDMQIRRNVPEYLASIPGIAQYLDVRQEKTKGGQRYYSADADRLFWIQGFIFSRSYNMLTRATNPNVPWHWRALDLFTGIRADITDRAQAENFRLLNQLRQMDELGLVKHGTYYYGAKTPEAKRAADRFNKRPGAR